MTISEIKKLLKNVDSVLILDDGEPSGVFMSYTAYRALMTNANASETRFNGEAFERQIPVSKLDASLNTASDIPSRGTSDPFAWSNGLEPSAAPAPLWNPEIPPAPQVTDAEELELLDRLNREIQNLRDQIALQEGEATRFSGSGESVNESE